MKYATMAGVESHISPHVLRHSKAMHLLEANVNMFYIKDFLGHADVATTEV
jgi:site-specific recombinase XerD